jgi:hypothetical protein
LLRSGRAHPHDEELFAFQTRNPRRSTRGNRHEDHDAQGVVVLETRAEEKAAADLENSRGNQRPRRVEFVKYDCRGRASGRKTMCGRYILKTPMDMLPEPFGISDL